MTTPRELRWVLLWAVFVMLLTCVPYLYALKLADGRVFGGFIWGVDDGNVYVQWMRQAAEGEAFLRNQYAPVPENPRFLNMYIQLGGRAAGLLHVPPVIMWHVMRLLAGVFLLVSFYLLAAEVTKDRVARWAALALASLGSGLGWLVVLKWPDSGLRPVDVGTAWQVQPEAVTFPSLLLNGLFVTSMALMCLTFLFALRGIRDGKPRDLRLGGLCLLVLGNIHTYDVVPVWLALGAWSLLVTIRDRSYGRIIGRLLGIVLIGLPSVLWAAYANFADPAFMAKGLTPTPAARLVDYVVGYGLIGLLAVIGAVVVLMEGRDTIPPAVGDDTPPAFEPDATAGRLVAGPSEDPGPSVASGPSLIVVWAIANSLVLLVPVSFQRKLIEGLHLPLCLLAGIATAWLASLIVRRLRARGKYKHAMERVVLTVCAMAVLCLPSNALFVSDCIQNIKTNNEKLLQVLQPPMYLAPPTARALAWLGRNSNRHDVVASSSLMGSYIPTYGPAKVWAGHWAETLGIRDSAGNYVPHEAPLAVWDQVKSGYLQQVGLKGTMQFIRLLYMPLGAEAIREEAQEHHVTMVLYSQWEQGLSLSASSLQDPPLQYIAQWRQAADDGLQKVYDEEGVQIYRVPQVEK